MANQVRSPSPSQIAVFERASMEVEVRNGSFSWDDLSSFLTEYLEAVKDESFPDSVCVRFCNRLVVWLKNPNSKKLDPVRALESWQKEVNDVIDDFSTLHFPKIEIVRPK